MIVYVHICMYVCTEYMVCSMYVQKIWFAYRIYGIQYVCTEYMVCSMYIQNIWYAVCINRILDISIAYSEYLLCSSKNGLRLVLWYVVFIHAQIIRYVMFRFISMYFKLI